MKCFPGLVVLIGAVVACRGDTPHAGGHPELSRPPIDATLRVTADTVASWPRSEVLVADLNGDGRTERLVLASDVTLGWDGEPLWEDGHRWGAFVEEDGRRTLLYAAFLPHSVAELAVSPPDASGPRQVLIFERGPQHARALTVTYDSVGSARLLGSANYLVERWLTSLTEKAQQRVDTIAPRRQQAPWSLDPLSAERVPREYMTAWRSAANRTSCALIAPADTRVGNARPRVAQFSGGWAVAYDTPEQRSAFGVAGTGAGTDSGDVASWPRTRIWSDGSSTGWGPEGGTGPNQLAYVHIAGQRCLYNVWSRIHEQHLLYLLQNLRFVRSD